MSDSSSDSKELRPYAARSGADWTRREATHLLRRTQYGATSAEIDRAITEGLDRTLDRLLTRQPETAEFESAERLLRRTAFDTGSIDDLKAWWLYRMLNTANPLVEKMSLFWHSHFATSNDKVKSVPFMAAQNDLIRTQALGNFRELLHGMARDVAMLIWLDSNANRKRQPNENFAREVMELFSLDVGHYTEQDIKEAARAFSGWHVREDRFWFNTLQHDDSDKTVLGRTGNLDGNDVIDLCLAQPACPEFLARKLLRNFALPAPSPEQVSALAGSIRKHDFRMAPVLRELLRSELFFSPEARSTLLKSPLDLVLGAHHTLETHANLTTTARVLADLGQDVFAPPTVKGWDGGRLWISSTSMLQRANFVAELATGNRFGSIGAEALDPPATTDKAVAGAPDAVVRHFAELLLNQELLPDVESKLSHFLQQPLGSREQQLRGMIQVIMSMPEFQLI